jgi:acyl-CoA synthetase (AMP-forming)/AMP-acid ligase II
VNFVDFLFSNNCKLKKDAVIIGDDSLSFADLYRLVIRFAGFLFKAHGQNQLIPIIADNSIFYILCYLAVIKSGNVAIPIDTNLPPEKFRKITEKSNSSIACIQEKYLDKYKLGDFKTIYSQKVLDSLEMENGVKIKAKKTRDLAVIIFTSGSEGDKKGVMLSHGNLMANTQSIVTYLKLKPKDRMLVVLPFFYVYGSSLLHTHLYVGGSLVLQNNLLFTAAKMIKKYNCTGLAGVPSTFQLLMRHASFLNEKLPSLRYITCSGGKLPNRDILSLIDAFPKKKMIIMYGTSEGTSRLSYLPPNLIRDKLGSIGKGIPNVELKVINENGTLVKPGEVGEIIAKGENIMLGYFANKELTRKVIKKGYYYSNDLATVDKDGYIYYLGRKQFMIKAGGFRTSPFEIEEVVHAIPEISQVAAFSIEDEELGEAVALVIESTHPMKELEQKIHKLMKLKMSIYLFPKLILVKEHLPLNSSHKIDRALLQKEIQEYAKTHL